MIEEQARVIAVDKGYAWVEAERKSACGSCGVKQGCGTSALAKAFPQRANRMRVADTLGVQVGQMVKIGLAEEALLGGAFWVYMVPLLGLFVGAGLGETCANLLPSSGEWLSVVLGVAGLYSGYRWARQITHQRRDTYQPVMLSVVTPGQLEVSLDGLK